MAGKPIDIIYHQNVTHAVGAEGLEDEIWLKPEDLERVTGFSLKPEGFCRGETCIPIPPKRRAQFVRVDRLNLMSIADLIGEPVVADPDHDVWCIGEAAAERAGTLRSLEAPDFELPDLDGKLHSLGRYRGRKVLLVSWASW